MPPLPIPIWWQELIALLVTQPASQLYSGRRTRICQSHHSSNEGPPGCEHLHAPPVLSRTPPNLHTSTYFSI